MWEVYFSKEVRSFVIIVLTMLPHVSVSAYTTYSYFVYVTKSPTPESPLKCLQSHKRMNRPNDLLKWNLDRFFSDSVGIYISLDLVYWALLRLAWGILWVFIFLLTRHCVIGLLFSSSTYIFNLLFFLMEFFSSDISLCNIFFYLQIVSSGFFHTIRIKE